MIDCFLGDALGVLFRRFWSTVPPFGARLPIHTLDYWTVQSVVPVFLTGGVFACDLAHRRSVSVLCMLYKIRCNPMHPLYGALPCSSCAVCAGAGYTRRCDSTSVNLCASSLQNLAVSPDFCALLGVSVEPS